MKLTAKSFVPVGGTVVITDEEKKEHKGVVEQANADGALFVRLPGVPYLQIAWAPKPESAAVAATAEKGKLVPEADMAAFYAEMERVQNLAADRGHQLENAHASIKSLTDKLALAEAALIAKESAAGVKPAVPTPATPAPPAK